MKGRALSYFVVAKKAFDAYCAIGMAPFGHVFSLTERFNRGTRRLSLKYVICLFVGHFFDVARSARAVATSGTEEHAR